MRTRIVVSMLYLRMPEASALAPPESTGVVVDAARARPQSVHRTTSIRLRCAHGDVDQRTFPPASLLRFRRCRAVTDAAEEPRAEPFLVRFQGGRRAGERVAWHLPRPRARARVRAVARRRRDSLVVARGPVPQRAGDVRALRRALRALVRR